MDISIIKAMNKEQIINYCHTLQAVPSLWILWVGSVFLLIVSFIAVLDFSRVNLNKLITAFILYIILSLGFLFFLVHSPHIVNQIFSHK